MLLDHTLKEINLLAHKINREIKIMELCGTHSQTVAQYNIKSLLPDNIKLITGPGCPICVTGQSDIDNFVAIALSGVPVAVYGDVLKVPGNNGSLEQAKHIGADVNVIYSVDEALKLKQQIENLVFFGLGFETTAPMTAWAAKKGLVIYSSHKSFAPAMQALLENKNLRIDGFINPGHVSAVIGCNPYKKFRVPQVIAGFEPQDVLAAIKMLLDQIANNCPKLENQYIRLVRGEGNLAAKKAINEVFELSDAVWRGFGIIKNSGLELKKEFDHINAKIIFKEILKKTEGKNEKQFPCECGLIVQGIKEPEECSLFGRICTPSDPKGACMVSSEGACNIQYRC